MTQASTSDDISTHLPADAHPGRVRLRVADIERSLGFYRDLLGFRVGTRHGNTVVLTTGDDPATPDARPSAPNELVVLQEIPGIGRRPLRPVTTGLYHTALLVPNRRALGRAIIALRKAGYPLRGMSDHSVSESLYLDDPDGNPFEIYADRPRSEWRRIDGVLQIGIDPIDLESVLAAGAERPAPWAGLPRETVVGHVHFTVADLERTVPFYRDVVGLDVMFSMPTMVAVSTGGYHHHINLNTWAGVGAPPDSRAVAGLEAWELVVPDATARQALIARLTSAESRVQRVGDRVSAADPDGIQMEIVGA
jgi:catechol 2,3-dioxygenase